MVQYFSELMKGMADLAAQCHELCPGSNDLNLHCIDFVNGVVGVFESLIGLAQGNEGAAEWPVVAHLVEEVEESVSGETDHPQVKGFEGVGGEDELVFDGVGSEGHVGGWLIASGVVRTRMWCRWQMWIQRSLYDFLYLVRSFWASFRFSSGSHELALVGYPSHLIRNL